MNTVEQTNNRKDWLALGGACWICAIAIWAFAYAIWLGREQLRITTYHHDLKWIGMALHQYHDLHGSFPPVVVRDEDGTALHSWRSLIQPQLFEIHRDGQRSETYSLSEPWDSSQNQQSLKDHRFGRHRCQFLAVVGEHAAWQPDGVRRLREFTDGTSQTILVIAVRDSGIPWNQPTDAVVTDAGTLTVNGRPLDVAGVEVFVLKADGTVSFFKRGIEQTLLRALLTIDAGDSVTDF
jgi:hypothetical protein